MEKTGKQRLAHICILVRDIDRAIEHYTKILGVASPEQFQKKATREECFAGQDRYVTSFFHAGGNGCDIQLLQPLDPASPLYKRLEKYGEGVHHIAFTSSRLDDTYQELVKNEITLQGDQFFFDENKPDTRWAWISPRYAHGVLIEVMDEYRSTEG
jgi:catechol 2,3-dioxygenase-like lactoylglutathione lyase family enzyme